MNNQYISISAFMLLFLFMNACTEEPFVPVLIGDIRGEILNGESGEPVVNASVSTTPVSTTSNSDSLGLFFLGDLLAGSYVIRIDKEGYISKSATVEVKDGEQTDVTINMDTDDRFNDPPEQPILLFPTDNMEITSVESIILVWTAFDLDGDDLKFSLRIYNDDLTFDQTLLEDSKDTSFLFTNLDYSSIYFWQVRVSDQIHDYRLSEVGSFQTPAFPLNNYYFARNSDNGEIQIYSTDLISEFSITKDGPARWRPRMNHDRNLVAFISTDIVEAHLYTMNTDGSNMQKISDVSIVGVFQEEVDFDWTTDDSRLIYPHYNKLISIYKDGTGSQELLELGVDRIISDCVVSESDQRIAVVHSDSRGYDAYIVLLSGQGQILDTVFHATKGRVGGLDISLDGRELLYTHDISGLISPEGRMLDSRIFIHDMETGLINDISNNKSRGRNDLDPKFSPTDGKIIFVNQDNNITGPGNVMIMDVDGTNRELLFENGFMPDWN
jgi:Tol biopolymer transport system component